MRDPLSDRPRDPGDLSRRGFLRSSSLVGAVGAVGAGTAATQASPSRLTAGPAEGRVAEQAAATRRWLPDPDAARFTIAVMPDTQFLFDGDSLHPEPVAASVRYLARRQRELNLVFLAHLGDVTQNGTVREIGSASGALDELDRAGASYSVLAGNHDIDESTDDQRGPTPYLEQFGPRRFRRSPSFRGSSPDGYNSFHTFRAGGREWLVLSLDWRLSPKGMVWARSVLDAHRTLPTIVVSHELVTSPDGSGRGELSPYGRTLWDGLIRGHDQVVLTLNGHDWPSARLVRRNDAGHDVQLHLTNYQQRYLGGAAMIRLYEVDLERKVVDVSTLNPFIAEQDPADRSVLAAQEVELSGDVDRFTFDLDPEVRFAGFAPAPARPRRPASAVLVPGTAAYWRFDAAPDGTVLRAGARVPDLSGRGNDLVAATSAGSTSRDLLFSDAHHPDQPSGGSLRLIGRPSTASFLRTRDGAPIDRATFERGYTVEAFVRLPDDFDAGADGFAAILSRRGRAGDAGLAGTGAVGDADEPVATLSISNNREAQWCVYPTRLGAGTARGSSLTSWGHELPKEQWWHLAVVNDTRHTTLYVDGCAVIRNPAAANRGLTTLGRSWLVGGYEYADRLDKTFRGWIGDLRIVERALEPGEFMIA